VRTVDFGEDEHVHFQFLHNAIQMDRRSVLLNQPSGAVPKAWILLDNQSTVDVFYNKALLRNIRKLPTQMVIYPDMAKFGITRTASPISYLSPG
jgi:hypothetical protein